MVLPGDVEHKQMDNSSDEDSEIESSDNDRDQLIFSA